MKRSTYLNVVLSAIAVLLAGNLWVLAADRPLLSADAHAAPPLHPGIPDAATQRKAIVDALRELKRDVQKTNTLLGSGGIRVEVTNIKELADVISTRTD